jgi:hypothetical protein
MPDATKVSSADADAVPSRAVGRGSAATRVPFASSGLGGVGLSEGTSIGMRSGQSLKFLFPADIST